MVVYIAQLMRGRENDEIFQERQEAIDRIEDIMKHMDIDESLEVVDSFDPNFCDGKHPIYCLGRSVQMIPQADFIYFCENSEEGRGCKIEMAIADEYNFPAVYANDPEEAISGEIREIYDRKVNINND